MKNKIAKTAYTAAKFILSPFVLILYFMGIEVRFEDPVC